MVVSTEWRKKWSSKGWVKWILPEKIKDTLKSIQEWGSIIVETKESVEDILNPITILARPIKDIISTFKDN